MHGTGEITALLDILVACFRESSSYLSKTTLTSSYLLVRFTILLTKYFAKSLQVLTHVGFGVVFVPPPLHQL